MCCLNIASYYTIVDRVRFFSCDLWNVFVYTFNEFIFVVKFKEFLRFVYEGYEDEADINAYMEDFYVVLPIQRYDKTISRKVVFVDNFYMN